MPKESKISSQDEGKKTPEEPTVDPVTIPLDSYCNGLGDTGVDKFARTMLQSEINAGRITPQDKTREEWENIYLKLKHS
jgi:hypothetical protein